MSVWTPEPVLAPVSTIYTVDGSVPFNRPAAGRSCHFTLTPPLIPRTAVRVL
eukprot:m.914 g.914  ORF g.914 m.914 type:complete len:52 (+) comp528_c0_seq1:216-371(+)